ncbi:MAG: preprotein translocase subunit YajC [Phycisphaerales bacterium]|nr:preprotein translocase subunit YajC [Phycisphaerales bacterium]
MTDLVLSLLAQAGDAATGGAPAGGGTGTPAQPGGGDSFFRFFLPLILMFVIFYWLMYRGQKKERQKQVDMLNSIKKGDRIQTIGGILGSVVEVRDHEVVVKVDESNNVKIRFNRAAVKEVLADGAAPAAMEKN